MEKNELIDRIKKECATLLNDSQIKTTDKAKEIASRLLQHGVQPSWRLIREVLGTGSATTLQNVVNNYWNDLGKRIDHLEKRTDIPEALTEEFNTLWDNALAQAQVTTDKRLESAFSQAKAIEDNAKEGLAHLEHQLNEMSEQKEGVEKQLKQEKQQLSSQCHQWQQQLEQQQKDHQQLEALHQQSEKMRHYHHQQVQQLETHLTNEKQGYTTTIENLKAAQQKEITRQAQQFESMIDRYATELGAIKTSREKQEKTYQKTIEKGEIKREKATELLSEYQIENAILKQRTEQYEKIEQQSSQTIASQREMILTLEKEQSTLEAQYHFQQQHNETLSQQLNAKQTKKTKK